MMSRINKFLIVLLGLASFTYSQEIDSKEVDIIGVLISRDTIIDERRLAIIADNIEKGVMTKKDSVKFVQLYRERKPKLYALSHNDAMTEQLKQDLRESGPLTKKMSKDVIRDLIERVPVFSEWKAEDFRGIADLVYEPDLMSTYHKFSNPVQIENNQFLIYHVKFIGPLNGFTKLLIYEVGPEGGVLIRDSILLDYN